jgi:hypothetical protein
LNFYPYEKHETYKRTTEKTHTHISAKEHCVMFSGSGAKISYFPVYVDLLR